MKPCISVLVPTRGRVALLQRMLATLAATAADMATVEVVFRVDDDDPETLAFLCHDWLRQHLRSRVVIGPRLNGYATLPSLINDCARLAASDLLIVINDDVVFRTSGWDTRLVEEAAKYPDGIFVLGVDTVMNNANWVFPCQSKTQAERLGGFFDERLLYPDIWLRDVMQPLGRLIRVNDVVIEHQWVGMTEDQQRAIGIVHQAGYGELYDRCVEEGRQKLRAALTENVTA